MEARGPDVRLAESAPDFVEYAVAEDVVLSLLLHGVGSWSAREEMSRVGVAAAIDTALTGCLPRQKEACH